MNFDELLYLAKEHDSFAVEKLHEMYKPLLMKNSVVDGTFDEDLYQILSERFLYCLETFKME